MPRTMVYVLVIAAFVGVMDLVGGLSSVMGLTSLATPALSSMPPGIEEPFDALMSVARKGAMVGAGWGCGLQVPVGCALLLGAYWSITAGSRARGVRVLSAALGVAFFTELGAFVVAMVTGWLIWGPTRELLDATSAAGGGRPEWVDGLITAAMVLGSLGPCGWIVLKCSAIAWAFRAVRHEPVVSWAEADGASGA